jgi:transposase
LELRDFGSAKQAAAYAGLTPRQRQSGATIRGQTRLSKIGNARVRKALYLPALTALRFNPLIKRMGKRLRERGKKEMVIVGAAMRKLIHQAYGVLKTGRPFNPAHAISA